MINLTRILLWGLCFFIVCPGHILAEKPQPEKQTLAKEIHVFLASQTLQALENNEVIYEFDVVTGQAGKETEEGQYKVERKHERYVSKTYGAEMPYSMFFSQDGKAIHGTNVATLRSYLQTFLTSSLGSKGCVGLTDNNAKALFEWAPVGTVIIVKQ